MARTVTKPQMSTTGRKSIDEKIIIWQKRRESQGVDWKDVSALELRVALATVLKEQGALMIAGAMGGRGVMLKVFVGDQSIKEFAANAEEVNELLTTLAESLGGGSEDLHEALRDGRA